MQFQILVHHSSTAFSSRTYKDYNHRLWFDTLRIQVYDKNGKILDSQPLQYSDTDGYIQLNAYKNSDVTLVICELHEKIKFNIPRLQNNMTHYYLNLKYDHDIIELNLIERPYGKTVHKITHTRK